MASPASAIVAIAAGIAAGVGIFAGVEYIPTAVVSEIACQDFTIAQDGDMLLIEFQCEANGETFRLRVPQIPIQMLGAS